MGANPSAVRPTLGAAIGSLVTGTAALCLLTIPLLAVPLGAVAVLSGLRARQELRRNDGVRGARLSLAGVLLGTAALIITAVPFLLPFVLAGLGLLRP